MQIVQKAQAGLELGAMRRARGVTGEAVARALDVDKSTLSKIEAGSRRLDVREFCIFATAIGLQPGDLLPHTEGIPLRFRPLLQMLEHTTDAELQRVMNVVAAMLGTSIDAHIPQPVDNVVAFQPSDERTKPRWSEEFPIKPEEFNEAGDTDFPLDLHGWEVDDIVAAAGAAGINPETPMTTILNAKEVREGRVRSVKVHGDSMSPTLEPGWKIAVDLWEKNPSNDDVVLVYRKDEGMILGRWEKTKSGVRLLKDNDRYQPVPLEEGDQLVGTLLRIIDAPIPKRRKR